MTSNDRGANTHNYGGVWGNVNSNNVNQYNFQGPTINVTVQHLEAARKVAQHQPRRDPASAVGRASELSALKSELEHHPCVAITGVGGIGKSTLAAMLGADSAAYTHRCWRNLSESATDFSTFIQAALATLGLSFDPREMPQPSEQAEHLAQILHDNPDVRLLIVLDNFESTIAQDGSLALGWRELLDHAAHNFGPSRLLITSRELPLLPQGQEPRHFSLSGLSLTDGLALLRQLGVTAGPADLATTITRSGGHPLALRFLADLITNEDYTLAQLLHEPIWDERNVERLLDKIYQTLALDQQQTLSYFSLFDRPTTPDTISGTLANLPDPPQGWNEQTIRRHATTLTARSLLDNAADRYTIHPIVRAYAYDLLGDAAPYHAAAASYFQQKYHRTHTDAHSHPALNLADMEPLLDAYAHLLAAEEYDTAANLLYGTPLEYMSGDKGVALYELLERWSDLSRSPTMLEHLANAPTGTLNDSYRAVTLGNLGSSYYNMGEYDKAIDYHARHLELATKIGDIAGQSHALGNLGITYRSLRDYDKATKYHTHQLELAQQMGDIQDQANSLDNLGLAYDRWGEYHKAIDYFTRTLELAQQMGDIQGQTKALGNLGIAYHRLGEYPQAIYFHSRYLELARQIGDQRGQANAIGNLGSTYDALGQYPEALNYYQQARAIFKRIGANQFVALTDENIARTQRQMAQAASS